MPKLKMTDAAVRQTTAAAAERIDYFDAHPRDRQRGLVLRVSGSNSPAGVNVTRTWALLCRVQGSDRLRRFTIGDYPAFSLAEARERAGEMLKQAKRGIDPLSERRAEVEQKRANEKDTVEALIEDFLGDLERRPKRKGGKRSPRYIAEVRRNFTNHVIPQWKGRNIREITRRNISELLDAVADGGSVVRDADGQKRQIEGGPIASNRVLSALSSFFNWLVDKGVIESTPAARLTKRGEETRRERALDDDEIRFLWPHLEQRGYPFGSFYQVALLTGQRRGEVARMRWDEIDEKDKTWTLPGERTKSGRPHVVPLSPATLAILADAKKQSLKIAKAKDRKTHGPFVFSTSVDAPISGYSRAKSKLDSDIAHARKKARQSVLKPWTVHDLRRTVATHLAGMGVDRFIISRILNHADRSVTGIYDRHGYLSQKREALDAWAQKLATLASLHTENVVNLNASRIAASARSKAAQ